MKNILILAVLSAVILTGCGNISPPFKAEQTTVTTAAPTVSAAASSEAESTVDEEQVKSLEILSFFQALYTITWEKTEIENQDWNKIWEENFTPILVQDQILVRAGFHPTLENIEHEIIIDPKMSFGTGHHATTALMLETILDMKPNFSGKKVLDMGCGTGKN